MIHGDVNSFNFGRMGMVARYYAPQAVRILIIYAAVTFLMFVLCLLAFRFGNAVGIGVASLIKVGIGFMFYLSPLAFSSSGSMIIAMMLPARASEKFLLILTYCIVVVPLVVAGVWTLLWCLSFWWTDVPQIWNLVPQDASELSGLAHLRGLTFLSNIQEFLPWVTVLWVVMASRGGVVAKAVVAALGSLVAMAIGGMLIGLACVTFMVRNSSLEALENVKNNVQLFDALESGSDGLLTIGFIAMSVVIVAYVAFALWKSYRLVAHRQI